MPSFLAQRETIRHVPQLWREAVWKVVGNEKLGNEKERGKHFTGKPEREGKTVLNRLNLFFSLFPFLSRSPLSLQK